MFREAVGVPIVDSGANFGELSRTTDPFVYGMVKNRKRMIGLTLGLDKVIFGRRESNRLGAKDR
jgi:hypothetical protein